MSDRTYHFVLTGPQHEALLDLLNALEQTTRFPAPLTRAFIALDEQRAKQDAPWERCVTCKGSGWVEDA